MKSVNILWSATSEVAEHFSKMGGSNRPSRMLDSDVFLYVATEAMRLISKNPQHKFPDIGWISEALSERRNKIIGILSNLVESEEAKITVDEYIIHYDSKLKRADKSDAWIILVEQTKSGKEN